MTIIKIPIEEYIYEFMVVTFWMTNENGEPIFEFRKSFEDKKSAEKYALEIGGEVIHNQSIYRKRLSKFYKGF